MMPNKNKFPKVVLVGPTNVGKSALFNRLTGTRSAIVCDRPGVTVDRHELRVSRPGGLECIVVDTGGVGIEARKHPLGVEIERAARVAVEESDLVLFVVDGHREMNFDDLEIASWLRSVQNIDHKKVWIVANKKDVKGFDSSTFYALGFGEIFEISAEHDIGVLDLWDAIENIFRNSNTIPDLEIQSKTDPKVLVLGRPNVGKSTLLNSILGYERHVVSDLAGTTRDPIESPFKNKHGIEWMLYDTPGLRQPGRLERGVEWVAREKLKEIAKRADVAIVVLDAKEGVSDLDASIVGLAIDFGLSVILAYNKMDLMKGEQSADLWMKLTRTKDLKLDFVEWCPEVQISALTGKGINQLVKMISKVVEDRKKRVQTSSLNTLFEKRIRLHHHPLGPRGKPAKFYYLSQVSASPPEFVLFSNLPGRSVHYSYRRFITNTLRTEFGFTGTPIRLHFKTAT
jgi:GTP-binding protein